MFTNTLLCLNLARLLKKKKKFFRVAFNDISSFFIFILFRFAHL